MTRKLHIQPRLWALILALVCLSLTPRIAAQTSSGDDSDASPPVSPADMKIVQRARAILDSPAKWNRADNRICPKGATTFSLYCALNAATLEITNDFEHRGAAMQEARFVIEEMAPKSDYQHRLMGYNNDPTTTFADVQKFFNLLEAHIAKRLKEEPPVAVKAASVEPAVAKQPKPVTETDLRVLRRAKELLDSPAKWNRADTQQCPPKAATVSLYCALKMADIDVNGQFDDSGAAIKEARRAVSETAPNAKQYGARLTGFNNDPSTTFADIQKLLALVEEQLVKRMAAK